MISVGPCLVSKRSFFVFNPSSHTSYLVCSFKHTLETEASESRTRRKKRATHARRKKRANHTDEKRGRRETNSKRVFRTLKAKLCQSVPIRAHPCRSGPLYTILCHPCRSGAFYAIPCPAVSIRAIRAKLCQSHRHHSTRTSEKSLSLIRKV